MHVPRNIYAIRQSLPADNYFRDWPRDLPKEVTIRRF